MHTGNACSISYINYILVFNLSKLTKIVEDTGQLFAWSADDQSRKHISTSPGRFRQKKQLKCSCPEIYCTAVLRCHTNPTLSKYLRLKNLLTEPVREKLQTSISVSIMKILLESLSVKMSQRQCLPQPRRSTLALRLPPTFQARAGRHNSCSARPQPPRLGSNWERATQRRSGADLISRVVLLAETLSLFHVHRQSSRVTQQCPCPSPLVSWYLLALLRSQLMARWADSFMTSPSCPVSVSWPSPSILLASTNMISPPRGVQASPMATPGWLRRSDTWRETQETV